MRETLGHAGGSKSLEEQRATFFSDIIGRDGNG